MPRSHRALSATLFVGLFVLIGNVAQAGYIQTNLVSDIAGLATIQDPMLVNPWGISHSPISPFWTSNQATSTATLYAVTGSTTVTKTIINPPGGFVSIPQTLSGPQGPTGQVNNTNTSSFQLTPGIAATSSRFIFANLNGTISFWAGGAKSTIEVNNPGAIYTGLAINSAGTRLYAADSAGGVINVFDSSSVATVTQVSLPGAFTAPSLPPGYVPFNVRDIGGKVYVTYAPAGAPVNRQNAVTGQGFVSVFDENGVFLQRLITGSELAAPWGIALAPATFGEFGGDLLVGNFSYLDSVINAFDPTTGLFEGAIHVDPGSGNSPGGLWALDFGIGVNNGNPNTLYFTDGINREADGLFAAITVPEPSTLALLAAGLLSLCAFRRRRFNQT